MVTSICQVKPYNSLPYNNLGLVELAAKVGYCNNVIYRLTLNGILGILQYMKIINELKVKMTGTAGNHRTGGLTPDFSVEDITAVLGEPNVEDDPDKVTASWGFSAYDEITKKYVPCGIWDYKGDRWSVYGPMWVFQTLFDMED